jgi:hypothetical protein
MAAEANVSDRDQYVVLVRVTISCTYFLVQEHVVVSRPVIETVLHLLHRV